jgi:serine/threonine protein kinase/WD40 repeat protein
MDAPLKNIKGYEIRERIGAGGFGAVYKAYQTTIGREVAIKVILPDRANQPDFIRRFESEAQLVARLEHPHIVPLYDYWRDPNGAYLVMRWLRGGSLRDALATGAFELRAILPLLDQITSALALAHRGGIIHRDIKPGNILLDEDGNAYLTDFGIAKDLSIPSQTASDMLIGSLDYISPEQARGERVTPRTDIYSLGVTLYEMITGHHPFEGISSVERLYKHINDPLPIITTLDAGVQEAVNTVIQKATAKNPEHRYADVLALAAEFRAAVGVGATTLAVEAQLTQREHEILQLIVDGLANKEIAQRLTLTLSTIKWHVNQIYSKLGVRSRVQAIIRARELDLLGKGSADGATLLISTADFNPINPYKGLLAFQSADSQDFFGREKITTALVKRMGESGDYNRFLAVVGPSGSGKSSLVKAGLIPALWRGELSGSERWFVAEMLPGTHPLDELEVALIRIAANQGGNLHEHLRRDERGLVRCAGLILPNDGTELVLVIDQFEEVYTLASDEDERAHFLALLCAAVTEPRSRIRVVITLRADFYDRPLHDPQFGDLVRSRLETIMPLSAEELERAIVRPAERTGATFEPGLVTTIIGDVNYQPGALPLLQFALTELFERRQGRLLTRAAYDAIGGTTGALAKRAEEVYLGFAEREREIARQIFLRLVTLGEGVEDTRRRATRSEFKAIAGDSDVLDDILDTLAAYRLLALDTDPATRTPTVELAHEALLREWERLRTWLNEARDDIKTQRQITIMAEEWRAADHDASFLARGSRLAGFEGWRSETTLALSQVEREFLDASLTQRQRDVIAEGARQAREQSLERRSRTFLRGLVGVLLLALLISTGLTVFALDRESQAQGARDEAVSAFRNSERQRLSLRADQVMDAGANGNIGFALAIRSLEFGYSPEADIALQRALDDGIPLRSLPPVRNGIYSLFYSNDGTLIAVTGEAVVRIVDAATGFEVQTLLGDEVFRYAEFAQDDQLLVVLGDSTLTVWDTATWELLHRIEVGGNIFGYLSPNAADSVFVHFSEGEILEFNIRTGAEIRRHPLTTANGDGINRITYDPDGNLRYVVKDTENRLILVNPETEAILCTLIDTPSASLTWAVQPTYSSDVLIAAQGSRVFIYDFSCNKIAEFAGHEPGVEIWVVDLLSASDLVATGDSSSQVIVWNLQTGVEIARFSPTDFTDLVLSPDGKQIVIGDFETAYIWDLAPLQEARQIVINSISPFPQFAANGQSIYVGGFGQPYGHWSLDGRNLAPNFDFDWQIRGFDISDDGRMMAVSLEEGRAGHFSNYIINPATGEILHELIGHTELVNYISFSPDETQVLSGGFDLTAQIWEVATGERVQVFTGLHNSVIAAFWSPDGQYILTISADNQAAIWDVTTGEVLLVVEHGGAALMHGSFAPDGRTFATASTEGFATIWDAETGEMLQRIAHPNVVFSTHFSPDNRYLLTACWDGMVRLWDVTTGELVRIWNTELGEISSATFSPNGQFIVAANGGTNTEMRQPFVNVWRVDLDTVIANYCARSPLDLTPDERTQYGITDDAPICPPPGA